MIVLDTHAWLWLADDPKRLSRRAVAAIEGEARLGVCAISAWELAMLRQRGRIELALPILTWINKAFELPKIIVLPLTPEVAVYATELDTACPDDPADRFIIATAVMHAAALVTKDKRIRSCRAVRTIW